MNSVLNEGALRKVFAGKVACRRMGWQLEKEASQTEEFGKCAGRVGSSNKRW